MRTFVVRVWEPADGGASDLHGVVEEVATGERVTFADGDHLVETLALAMTREEGKT